MQKTPHRPKPMGRLMMMSRELLPERLRYLQVEQHAERTGQEKDQAVRPSDEVHGSLTALLLSPGHDLINCE